jgi:organic radical activating enzyme
MDTKAVLDEFSLNYTHRRTLEVTTIATCPVNCAKYCPQDVLKTAYSGHSLLLLSDFRKALSHVPKDVRIHFSGYGEPFLNPFAKDMILHTHNEGYDIALFTTLSNITAETFNAIKHVPFKRICIHLPDVDGITKVKLSNDYLTVLASLKHVSNVTFMSMGKILLEVREILPDYDYVFENIERAGNCQGTKPKRKLGKLTCFKLQHSQFVMLPDCTVTLCCMDYGMRHRLGNLLRDKYDDLMNSEEMTRVLKSASAFSDSYALCRTCKWATNTSVPLTSSV